MRVPAESPKRWMERYPRREMRPSLLAMRMLLVRGVGERMMDWRPNFERRSCWTVMKKFQLIEGWGEKGRERAIYGML